jgi:hypothetical protein
MPQQIEAEISLDPSMCIPFKVFKKKITFGSKIGLL